VRSQAGGGLAAFLQDQVVEDVGHAQWAFTSPKMLRVSRLHHPVQRLEIVAHHFVERRRLGPMALIDTECGGL